LFGVLVLRILNPIATQQVTEHRNRYVYNVVAPKDVSFDPIGFLAAIMRIVVAAMGGLLVAGGKRLESQSE